MVSLAGTGVASARTIDLTEEGRAAAVAASSEATTSETQPAAATAAVKAEPASSTKECEDGTAAVSSEPASDEQASSDDGVLAYSQQKIAEKKASGEPVGIEAFFADAQKFITGGGLGKLVSVVTSAVGLYNQAMANPASAVDPGFWGRVLSVITGGLDILKGADSNGEAVSSTVHNEDTLEVGGVTAAPEAKAEIEKRMAEDTEATAAKSLAESLEEDCLQSDEGDEPTEGSAWDKLSEQLSKSPEDIDQEKTTKLLDEVQEIDLTSK